MISIDLKGKKIQTEKLQGLVSGLISDSSKLSIVVSWDRETEQPTGVKIDYAGEGELPKDLVDKITQMARQETKTDFEALAESSPLSLEERVKILEATVAELTRK